LPSALTLSQTPNGQPDLYVLKKMTHIHTHAHKTAWKEYGMSSPVQGYGRGVARSEYVGWTDMASASL